MLPLLAWADNLANLTSQTRQSRLHYSGMSMRQKSDHIVNHEEEGRIRINNVAIASVRHYNNVAFRHDFIYGVKEKGKKKNRGRRCSLRSLSLQASATK